MRSAISGLESPSATRRTTLRSVAVRLSQPLLGRFLGPRGPRRMPEGAQPRRRPRHVPGRLQTLVQAEGLVEQPAGVGQPACPAQRPGGVLVGQGPLEGTRPGAVGGGRPHQDLGVVLQQPPAAQGRAGQRRHTGIAGRDRLHRGGRPLGPVALPGGVGQADQVRSEQGKC
jgi:hypothetical protein